MPLFALSFDAVGDDTSTDNLLGGKQLEVGAQLLLPVECGTYDISVTVAGGDQPPGVGTCLIADVDVCESSTVYTIDDNNCDLHE